MTARFIFTVPQQANGGFARNHFKVVEEKSNVRSRIHEWSHPEVLAVIAASCPVPRAF
jgi:hypothetical protein